MIEYQIQICGWESAREEEGGVRNIFHALALNKT